MDDGQVRLSIEHGVASVVFDRPQARNAMTWTMYEQLGAICSRLQADSSLRVATFRGAGGKAFVAGTDIAQFAAFGSADDGVAYEQRIDACIAQLERLPMPTLAIVEGWAVGGGLAITLACDLCVATPEARFGVPIARTLGNCLSVANLARVAAALGVARARRMLLLAEMLEAGEAATAGLVSRVAASTELDAVVGEICTRLASHAPLTMRASKEGLRRLVAAGLPDDEDLIRACYGSADFREGVAAFAQKRAPQWKGR